METAWRLATMTGDAAIGVHVAEALPRGALDLIECLLVRRQDRRDGQSWPTNPTPPFATPAPTAAARQ